MWNKVKERWAYCVALAGTALFVGPAAAMAEGPTYNVKPVTESISSELVANLPVILGVIGALIALAIAIRAIRKFVKV